MSIAFKFLAARLAEKEEGDYASTVGVLRTKFSFAAHFALVCLRGSRTLFANRNYRGM
jgi:hypothetical protein